VRSSLRLPWICKVPLRTYPGGRDRRASMPKDNAGPALPRSLERYRSSGIVPHRFAVQGLRPRPRRCLCARRIVGKMGEIRNEAPMAFDDLLRLDNQPATDFHARRPAVRDALHAKDGSLRRVVAAPPSAAVPGRGQSRLIHRTAAAFSHALLPRRQARTDRQPQHDRESAVAGDRNLVRATGCVVVHQHLGLVGSVRADREGHGEHA